MHMEKGIRDERGNETTDEDIDSDSDIFDDEGDVTLQEVGESSDDDESDSKYYFLATPELEAMCNIFNPLFLWKL